MSDERPRFEDSSLRNGSDLSLRRRLLGDRPTWVNVFIALGALVLMTVVVVHLAGGMGGLAMHQ